MDSNFKFTPPEGRTPYNNNPYNDSVLMHSEIPLSPPPLPGTPPQAHPPSYARNNSPYHNDQMHGNLPPPLMEQPMPQAPPPIGMPYTQQYPPPSNAPPHFQPPMDSYPDPDAPHYPSRSPSPTPSEIEESKQPFFSKNWREWIKQPKSWFYIFIGVVFIAIAITFGVLHDQLARDLQPVGDWLKSHPGGFLIPIAIMIVISFPPLFGHEFIALLVGDFYGLGVGFVIVAAGTLIGEIINFFVFRYFCFARGKKIENKSFFYACVSSAIRHGGFKMAALARYSAIPAHFTTTIFATCGMGFWTFLAAAVVSLPKQLGTVAAGALLASSADGQKANKLPSYILFAITIVATIIAQRYMRKKIDEHRLIVVRERRRTAAASRDSSEALTGNVRDRDTEAEARAKNGDDSNRGRVQQFWRRMSNGELSHVW